MSILGLLLDKKYFYVIRLLFASRELPPVAARAGLEVCMISLPLTKEQSQIHARALELSQTHRRIEWHLVTTLQEVERTRLFKKLNCSSLFQYAVRILQLSESVAYSFIVVSRKAKGCSPLNAALREQELSVSKASRVVSALDGSNASGLIEFAKTHTSREIDCEVARLKPKQARRDSVKPLSEDRMEIRISVSKQTYEKLKRVEGRGMRSCTATHAAAD